MKINSLSFDDKKLVFDQNVNLITGYTKKNKTLLFYAFEYLFCIDSPLDINQAKKSLHSDYISASFIKGNEIIEIKRIFSSSFEGYIDYVCYNNMKTYKKELAKRFDFDEVFVENSNQKNQFFLKDYLKLILIPEEQLTSPKNIFERNGELEKSKIKLFFEYMMTGNVLSLELINKATSSRKSATSISNFKTTFNRIYSKPKKNEIKEHEKIKEEKEKLQNRLCEIEKNKIDINKQFESIEISNKRLALLLDSYNQELKEFGLAQLFEDIENILEVNITKIDYEYYTAIRIAIDDLVEVKEFNEEAIKSLLKEKEKIDCEIKDIEQRLDNIEIKLHDYGNIYKYNNMIQLTSDLEKANEKQIIEIKYELDLEKNKIKTNFNLNMKKLCDNILKRINSWGIVDISNVSFDYLSFDFLFDGNPIKLQPKGQKSIFSFATNIEIILFMKSIKISIPNFIIIDSCWVASDLSYITQEELKNNIVKDLSNINMQIVIFENEDRKKRIDGCHYISL